MRQIRTHRYLPALLLAIMLMVHSVYLPVQTAYAKEMNQEQTARLSTEQTEYFINQTKVVNITLKDRQSEEKLTVTVDQPNLLSAEFGKWSNDTVKLILKPKMNGTAVITIKSPDKKETLTMKVHIQKRKLMSAGELYEYFKGAMVTLTSHDAMHQAITGSGCFISANEILTNYHVIEYANDLRITDYLGNTYEPADIVAYNASVDLAVIRVKENATMAFTINQQTVLTGETVYAIGSPLGLTGTISEGMVSKAERSYEGKKYHQNTAYISTSSGGGPLLNEYGEIIGIQTLVLTAGQNINFALKVSYMDFLDKNSGLSMEAFYEQNKEKIKPIEITITLN